MSDGSGRLHVRAAGDAVHGHGLRHLGLVVAVLILLHAQRLPLRDQILQHLELNVKLTEAILNLVLKD